MFGRHKKCYCMNNNYSNNECDNNNDMLESQCQNNSNCSCNMDYDDCECGFEEEYSIFPENPMLAQSYVPYQYMDKTFKPCVGLKMGTIFPELVSPYMPGQSMKEIEYIESMNKIGKGCNKCHMNN